MTVRVRVLPDPVRRGLAQTGGVTCEQQALVEVDRELLAELWTPSTLELLARSYWEFARRRTGGLVRVVYGPNSQTVTLAGRLSLLRFASPLFSGSDGEASVEWPIERGLLVARRGRDQGYLRIKVERRPAGVDRNPSLMVSSTVSNFYPWLRGSGRFARFGAWFYAQTQLRIHIAVTRGFLGSLDRLPAQVLREGVEPGSH